MIQYVNNEAEVLAAFAAWDSTLEAIVVSFRGTVQSITDWVHNFGYIKINPLSQFPNAGLHHGFWNSWQVLSPDVLAAIATIRKQHNTNKLMLTGHSLGAALAADAALDLMLNHGFDASVLNFGSPRLGDEGAHEAMQQLTSFWRVTHAKDLVPHHPEENLGFFHASTEVFFPGSDDSFTICDGSGEDNSCSNRCAKWLTCVSVSDHLKYLGATLGTDGCPNSIVV